MSSSFQTTKFTFCSWDVIYFSGKQLLLFTLILTLITTYYSLELNIKTPSIVDAVEVNLKTVTCNREPRGCCVWMEVNGGDALASFRVETAYYLIIWLALWLDNINWYLFCFWCLFGYITLCLYIYIWRLFLIIQTGLLISPPASGREYLEKSNLLGEVVRTELWFGPSNRSICVNSWTLWCSSASPSFISLLFYLWSDPERAAEMFKAMRNH